MHFPIQYSQHRQTPSPSISSKIIKIMVVMKTEIIIIIKTTIKIMTLIITIIMIILSLIF